MNLEVARTWYEAHRRELAGALGVFALGLALGFSAGRPARVEKHESQTAIAASSEQHQVHALEVAHQVAAAAATSTRTEQRHVVVHTVVHVLPSGERTITRDRSIDVGVHVEEAEQLAVTVNVSSALEAVGSSSSTSTTTRVSDSVQMPASSPRWRVTALAGVDVAHLKVIAPFANMAYGAHVERHLVGPLWAGAWGLSSGVAGVSLGVEW